MKLKTKHLILAAAILAGAVLFRDREASPSAPTGFPGYGTAQHNQAGRGTGDELELNQLQQQWQSLAQQAQMQALLSGAYGSLSGYSGGSPADPYMGGNFHGNSLLNTAVSSSGDSGYIALGDGSFVSW